MQALSSLGVGDARITDIAEPVITPGNLLLKIEMVGLCGTDLNSFRGKNPLVSYPRVLGHEIAATVVSGTAKIPTGTRVTVSPYTHYGTCPSCRNGRYNACRDNQTLGVQRDGGLTEWLSVPEDKVYAADLPLKTLCLVEPLTVGFHAVARGRVVAENVVAVFGCGAIGLGAIAGASFRGARTTAIDVDDRKLATARAAGATEIIHSGKEDFQARLDELTDGNGPSVIIEAIGCQRRFELPLSR